MEIPAFAATPYGEAPSKSRRVSVWLCSHREVSVVLMQTAPLIWPLSQQVEDLAWLCFLLDYNITAANSSNLLLCIKSQLGSSMYRSSYFTLSVSFSQKIHPSPSARKLYFSVPHYNWNHLHQPRTSHIWFMLSYIHLHKILDPIRYRASFALPFSVEKVVNRQTDHFQSCTHSDNSHNNL